MENVWFWPLEEKFLKKIKKVAESQNKQVFPSLDKEAFWSVSQTKT